MAAHRLPARGTRGTLGGRIVKLEQEGAGMLHVFAFGRIGVAIGDLYFVDPRPGPGQEGAERGVRVEVRLMESPARDGSIYASRPILVGQPIWRADLLESVAGRPGSYDRTHHHPRMRDWEPNSRQFDPAMSADPLGFVGERLADLDGMLTDAGVDPAAVAPHDAGDLRETVPEIVDTIGRMLAGVRAGRLARRPDGERLEGARVGWL
jgi:hypothetical protein